MALPIYRPSADHFAGANVPVKRHYRLFLTHHQHVVGVTMSVSQSAGEVLMRPKWLKAWVRDPNTPLKEQRSIGIRLIAAEGLSPRRMEDGMDKNLGDCRSRYRRMRRHYRHKTEILSVNRKARRVTVAYFSARCGAAVIQADFPLARKCQREYYQEQKDDPNCMSTE
jgi:hypothetical protein